jgi:hypothetical protein
MGWIVKHVQVGDRVAVVDNEAGRSAAVEPGQPEELARGPARPRTPARAQNALSVLGRPSARCLRLPIRTAGRRAFFLTFSITQRDPFRRDRRGATGLEVVLSEVPVRRQTATLASRSVAATGERSQPPSESVTVLP